MENLQQIKENIGGIYEIIDYLEIKGKNNIYYVFNIMSLLRNSLELIDKELTKNENKKDE